MPFHIHYTGPANISAMFAIRPSPEKEGTATQASFRGRAMVSTLLPLPRRYTGVVLRVDQPNALPQIHTLDQETEKRSNKRKIVTVSSRKEEVVGVKKRRTSPRKSVQKKYMARQQFSMDDDSDQEQQQEEEGEEGVGMMDIPRIVIEPATQDEHQEEAVAMVETKVEESIVEEIQQVVEEEPFTSFADPAYDEELSPSLEQQSVDLHPTSVYESITMWNPDGPLDQGGDIYWKAINEWTGLARLVRCRAHPHIYKANPVYIPCAI